MPDESTPDEIVTGDALTELFRLARQMYPTPKSAKGRPDRSYAHERMYRAVVLSPHDHIQATKHHPEFQRCLAVWRDIFRKEQAGIALTKDEEAMKWTPRSHFNGEAEMEASRYGLLSLAERERASMTEEEWFRRDCSPVLDCKNKVAEIRIPLGWTLDAIEETVARIVRVYKEWLGLTHAKYSGPPLNCADCAPQLLSNTLTLLIPLDHPVKVIDETVGQLVRTYKQDLGLTSSQRMRRPEHVDPWLVYRLHHDDKLSFADIARRLFELPDSSPAYNPTVKRRYYQVSRAYEFAESALTRIGEDYPS